MQIKTREVSHADLQAMPAGLEPLLKRVYAARGAGAEDVDTSLQSLLPVSRLDGAFDAAARLAAARENNEKILVVGDFDADGATATALMLRCLRAFGFRNTDYRVPDRFRFGYGLSAALVEDFADLEPNVVITVDNGISSVDGVAAANELGIDVIVTDHHLPGEVLPAAHTIVNPNAPANRFPSKSLAGVGVAFYCMAALGQELAARGVLESSAARSVCADCLDLVALGTVADLVPLDHNNRVLVAQGLARMRAGRMSLGIQNLFAVAGRSYADATAADLGFAVAPRLNAAGRLDDIGVGIECLLTDDDRVAAGIARQLHALNEARKELQSSMQTEAEAIVDQLLTSLSGELPDALCLYDPGWHQGVVGLVATRIKDQLRRPVIAFARGEDESVLKGSGRSLAGVHMRDMLAAVDARNPGLISRYGGHAMAAGLSLPIEKLPVFEKALTEVVADVVGSIADERELMTDGELSAPELNLANAELIRVSGPWGQGFPEPVFAGRFVLLEQRVVGGIHLKLQLQHVDGSAAIDAIAFNQAPLSGSDGRECQVAFKLDVNQFRGRRSEQLVVEHIECV